MESINEIKLDLIKIITSISDVQRLKSIYYTIAFSPEEALGQGKSEDDKFSSGQVEIREGLTKEQIFEEQGNKSITFAAV